MKTQERDSLEAPEPSRKKETEEKHGPLQFIRELPGLVLMAFLLALLIKTFLFQAFFIPSGSMEPTLMPGDRVLVNKIPYYFHDPRRGDIIVFENPHPGTEPDRGVIGGFFHWLGTGLGFSKPGTSEEDYIKRVIGLPGDVLEAHDGHVYVNGQRLNEPYLDGVKTADFGPTRVPDGQLFVMGDNRGNSLDSRFSLGTVPIDKVVGKAFVIIWPPSRIGLLH